MTGKKGVNTFSGWSWFTGNPLKSFPAKTSTTRIHQYRHKEISGSINYYYLQACWYQWYWWGLLWPWCDIDWSVYRYHGTRMQRREKSLWLAKRREIFSEAWWWRFKRDGKTKKLLRGRFDERRGLVVLFSLIIIFTRIFTRRPKRNDTKERSQILKAGKVLGERHQLLNVTLLWFNRNVQLSQLLYLQIFDIVSGERAIVKEHQAIRAKSYSCNVLSSEAS